MISMKFDSNNRLDGELNAFQNIPKTKAVRKEAAKLNAVIPQQFAFRSVDDCGPSQLHDGD